MLASSANALGVGVRRTSRNAIGFEHPGCAVPENVRRPVGDVRSHAGDGPANGPVAGCTSGDGSRGPR